MRGDGAHTPEQRYDADGEDAQVVWYQREVDELCRDEYQPDWRDVSRHCRRPYVYHSPVTHHGRRISLRNTVNSHSQTKERAAYLFQARLGLSNTLAFEESHGGEVEPDYDCQNGEFQCNWTWLNRTTYRAQT